MQSSMNKLVQNRWFLLAVAAIGAALIHPFAYFFLLILPFLFVVRVTRRNALVSIPIIFSLNVLMTIINAVLLDTFNIPITQLPLVLLATAEAALLIHFNSEKISFEVKQSSLKYLYIVYGLFALTIGARVLSVANLDVPILHDPMAHAFWASKIAREQAIDYFYSPGLHIWSMLTSESLGITTAQSVHLLTNIFSAFSVLAWSIAAFIFTKRGRIAMWTGLLVLLSPLPQFLYFMAGKNSFVMATPFLAVTSVFALIYYRNNNLRNFALLALCLVGVGLIHYPAFAFAAGLVLLFLVLSYFDTNNANTLKNPLSHFRKLTTLFLPVLLSLVLIGANVALTKAEDKKIDLVSSRAEAKEFHSKASRQQEVPYYEKISSLNKTSSTRIKNPATAADEFRRDGFAFFKSLPKDTGVLLLGAGLLAVYFLLAHKSAQKEVKKYQTMIIAAITATLGIIYLLFLYPLMSLNTTRDTGLLLLPLLLSLAVAWLLAHVSSRKILEYFVVAGLAIAGSYLTYSLYEDKSASSVVNEYDIQAYEWIDENIPDSEKFIGMSRLDPNRASIVFPIDGALWLPVMTDNQIANPFQELGFQTIESHLNYEYEKDLGLGGLPASKAAKYFTDKGYNYLYIDGEAAKSEFSIENLTEAGLVKLEFQNSAVQIYSFRVQ